MKLLKDDNLMLRETLRREQQVMSLSSVSQGPFIVIKGASSVRKRGVWCEERGV